jgi:DNA-binding NtrC family response regulator
MEDRCFPVETPSGKVHNLIIRFMCWLKYGSSRIENTPLDYYRGTETILVVDDEESLRGVIVDLLNQLGYHTLSAPSGDDALELAGGYPGKIDLLLTDVVMHPLPGPELAETLIRLRPEMKVIFISGYANASLAPDGVLKPGTVLVNKPFTMKILSAKMREVLESPRLA